MNFSDCDSLDKIKWIWLHAITPFYDLTHETVISFRAVLRQKLLHVAPNKLLINTQDQQSMKNNKN